MTTERVARWGLLVYTAGWLAPAGPSQISLLFVGSMMLLPWFLIGSR